MKKTLWFVVLVTLVVMMTSFLAAAIADDATEEPTPAAPQTEIQNESKPVEPKKEEPKKEETKQEAPANTEPEQTEEAEEQNSGADVETLEAKEGEKEIPVVVPETFTGSVKVELVNKGDLYFGDEIILRAKVEHANMPYELRWEVLEGKEWKPIPNEDKAEYRFIVDEENAKLQYRVVVITAD